jgi:hypothetical protein
VVVRYICTDERGFELEKISTTGETRQATHHNISQDKHSGTTTSTEDRALLRWRFPYHRRAAVVCCIIPGEIDDGGLAMRLPVEGLTMGMALLRDRIAEGWWILRLLLLVYAGGDM